MESAVHKVLTIAEHRLGCESLRNIMKYYEKLIKIADRV